MLRFRQILFASEPFRLFRHRFIRLSQKAEEFVIKKKEITLDFVKEIVKKEKISKEALDRAGGYEQIQKEMSNFI